MAGDVTCVSPLRILRFSVLAALVLLLGACSTATGEDVATDAEIGSEQTSVPVSASDSGDVAERQEPDESASSDEAVSPEEAASPEETASEPDEPADSNPEEAAGADEATAATCESPPSGASDIVMDSGGAEHGVRIFIPTAIDGRTLPVVVNWHGRGGTGRRQARYSDYERTAEREGFIVVHPTGVPDPGFDRNSWELLDEQDPGRDDLVFASELFDELIARWCGDSERIFSTGMSNGGYFTARLVCEMPERLAGAVSVGGLFHPPDCNPSETVPFRAYHGTADPVVPFDGSGESTGASANQPEAQKFFSLVMPDEFAKFAADAGCGVPAATEVTESVIRYDYPDCGVEMAFFEIVGGGHTWPGADPAAASNSVGRVSQDVSATEDGWSFFNSIG